MHAHLRAFVAFLLECYLTRQVLASAIRKLNMQTSISGISIDVLFLLLSHLQLMIDSLQQESIINGNGKETETIQSYHLLPTKSHVISSKAHQKAKEFLFKFETEASYYVSRGATDLEVRGILLF
jgi:hypothetical protein